MIVTKTTAYIGLGSNLSNPIAQVKTAINEIKNIARSQFLTVSSLYLSKPQMDNPQEQVISGSTGSTK